MSFTGERFIPGLFPGDEMEFEHLQRYYSIVDAVKDKIVLDAATGEGYGANILADSAKQVYAIDIDEEAITHAQKKYLKDNLTFIQASIEKLPLGDRSIDVVISFETIEHVDENAQHKFLAEVKRVLKEDGILIISTPNKKVYSDLRNHNNLFHKKEFYEEEYRDFLEYYFKNVEIYYQRNEVVYLLSKKKAAKLKNIELDPEIEIQGKYLIAVCTNSSKVKFNIDSIILDENKYWKMNDRILQLQQEVEERNNHIIYLDREIENHRIHHSELQARINEIENNFIKKEKEFKNEIELLNIQKEELENKLKLNEIEFQNKLRSYEEKMKNIEKMLIEKERDLNNILTSDGWNILSKYYKVRDTLFPYGTRKRLLLKLVYKVLFKRHIKLINKHTVKKFIYYLKNDKPYLLEKRIDNFIEKQSQISPKKELFVLREPTEYNKLIFTKYENPTVSIIIPVYNNWSYTYSCLQSILTNTKDVSYEVIIADDMSNDETKNIKEYVENIKVIRDGVNRGFLLNCNNAANYAIGKYILFLNNDTNVQENWLCPLVTLMEKDPQIGLVGSKLVYPDGRLQEAGGIIWSDASGWNFGRFDDPEKSEYNYVKEVDYISGASIMIRADLWRKIGGFDKRYAPAYFEDSDLAFEVRKLGYKVVYHPKSVVVHFEGISHGIDVSEGVKSYQIKNKQKFIEKWSHLLKDNQFNNGEHVFLARDRSKNKKCIVVIDHYVPHFDQDAGSRTTYQYLKLFVDIGFNVKFIGDNFYRHEPYTSKLQELGIEVLYGAEYASHIERWFIENGSYIDYVYLNRPHISVKYIDMVRKHTKARIIYYGHDLHFLRELREYELTGNKLSMESHRKIKKVELELCQKADVVYFPSPVEVNELKKYLPSVNAKVLPAYIFEEKKFDELKWKRYREGILFVGGFNHRPNIDAVLWFCKEVYPLILKEIPNMKFYIIGSNPPENIKNLASENVIVTGFITDEELTEYYLKCKLAVVPLRYGAGVKGKVIEAMYNEVPIVTTRVGAEGIEGSEGVLTIANDSDDFAQKVIELYKNDEKLIDIARNSVEYVNQHYSVLSAKNAISEDIKF